MVNITFNPTINLFYFYAPPMGHSFNPLLHQPLIPPLDQQMSCRLPVSGQLAPKTIRPGRLAPSLWTTSPQSLDD